MKLKNQKGFTLIELLVVIAIIGILSTLAIVALQNARQKARDAKRVSDVKQLVTALELFYGDKTSYPITPTTAALGTGSSLVLCDLGFQADATGCTTTYMGKVPTPPGGITGDAYTYAATPASCLAGACTGYSITFLSENTAMAGLATGTGHTADPTGIK